MNRKVIALGFVALVASMLPASAQRYHVYSDNPDENIQEVEFDKVILLNGSKAALDSKNAGAFPMETGELAVQTGTTDSLLRWRTSGTDFYSLGVVDGAMSFFTSGTTTSIAATGTFGNIDLILRSKGSNGNVIIDAPSSTEGSSLVLSLDPLDGLTLVQTDSVEDDVVLFHVDPDYPGGVVTMTDLIVEDITAQSTVSAPTLYTGGGGYGYSGVTIDSGISADGGILAGGSISVDAGTIYSDGSGNLTANMITLTSGVAVTGNVSVTGGSFVGDGSLVTGILPDNIAGYPDDGDVVLYGNGSWGAIPDPPDQIRYDKVGPRMVSSGTLFAFGDSQTYGSNSTAGGGRLAEADRWVNMVATDGGRTLTVVNNGLPGEKISSTNAVSSSIWFKTGTMPYNWEGVATVMAGFNNTGPTTTTEAFYSTMEKAYRGFVARMLIDDYAGLGVNGYGRTGSGGGTLHSFTTTGTSANISSTMSAFPDNTSTRYLVQLTAGQYIEWTLTGKQATALFLLSGTAGGDFVVTVNGNQVARGSTQYTNLEVTNDPAGHQYPIGVWVDDLPDVATIRITASSGTNFFQAYGWKDRGVDDSDRTILVTALTGNNDGSRKRSMLEALNYRMIGVVSEFEQYPVYFADVITGYNGVTMAEPTDTSHFNSTGNRFIANGFNAALAGRARKLRQKTDYERWQEAMEREDNIRLINLDPGTWTGSSTGSGGVSISTPNAALGLRAGNSGASTFLYRNNSTGALNPFTWAGLPAGVANWQIPMRIAVDFTLPLSSTNSVFYILFGRPYNVATVGDLSTYGLGAKIENRALKITTHNGTTPTLSGSMAAVTSTANTFRLVLQTNGTGGISASLDGKEIYTGTGAPFGQSGANATGIEVSADTGGDAAYAQIIIRKISISRVPDQD